jgi:nitronate monooxygenase
MDESDMSNGNLPSLRIGDLEINPPIIQGGMGVRVSRAGLAAAVANEGCAGVIATVGLGRFEDHPGSKYMHVNGQGLRDEIRKARTMTDGVLGVNVMVALTDYDNLAGVAADEGVDLIISGAGLPLDLPKFVEGKATKLVPIVSSARALAVICRKWQRTYDRLPDAVVVEGVKAGGHLGFSFEEANEGTAPDLDDILKDVIETANSYTPAIPVIAAGGIFDGSDIARVLRLGAAGVQMATRFVCTDECDADQRFKQAYLDAKKEDITIIRSPVGLPGRVLNSPFVERVKRGETIPFKCSYKCLKTCDPKTVPYCIAKVLVNAADGNLDRSFAFSGENSYRIDKIVPVKELVAELAAETILHLGDKAR